MRKPILLVLISALSLCGSAMAKDPSARYISLAPSTTEILFALGLDKEVLAVSSYCNYPPEASKKEKIGDFSSPNVEKIAWLKPDFIFCTGLEQAPVIEKLKKIGLKVYVCDPVSLKGLYASIEEIGGITSTKEKAAVLVENIKNRIASVSAKLKSIPRSQRKKVFVEIWNEPLTTAGKGSYMDELITLAGGINIASDTIIPYSIFSQEEVIKRDPDCIIIAYMDKKHPAQNLKKRFGWQKIKAVENSRVFNDINPDILLRPGPRIAQAVEEVYKRLYENED